MQLFFTAAILMAILTANLYGLAVCVHVFTDEPYNRTGFTLAACAEAPARLFCLIVFLSTSTYVYHSPQLA